MQILTDLVAALTLTAYLGAALLPCEPPASFVEGKARPTSDHGLASPASDAGRASETAAGSHPAPHSHHTSSHASGHASSHTPNPAAKHSPSPTPVHASHPSPSESHPHEHPQERRLRGVAQRELVAKCLCGCADTRAYVGGGAARLGAVVPGVFVARLPEAIDPAPLDRTALRVPQVDHEIDPIPI